MQDAPKDIAGIKDYHAHIYYDPASRDRAATLRGWVEERFAGQMRMGSWHDEPVGPHVQAMYQIAFPPGAAADSGAVSDAEPHGADDSAASAVGPSAR